MFVRWSALLIAAALAAQSTPPATQTMVVSADMGRDTISRHIYGHFAEHLGRLIYDGIWTRQGSGAWTMRDDVVQALRAIKIPNLRWPGGCFADYYNWKAGVGPLSQRPTIVNNHWGGVTEDNGVGTHEYLDLVARLGAEPFIVANMGSGTVREMWEWWEYLNHPGPSPMADLRKRNGREQPWNVRFWGVGNENWGCGGNMRPEYYADEYRRYASFLPRYGDVRAFRIAAGPNGANYEWMDVMMRQAGNMIDGIDVHQYLTARVAGGRRGSATAFTESEWADLLAQANRVDEVVTRHATIMDRYDPTKRVWMIVGEWGTWHEVEPGTNPGFLYQQNTLRDAIAASVVLDIFNKHADRVKMANIAQTVNVLQAMILTRGNAMLLTPTYHVFEFYTVHHDATLLPTVFDAGKYTNGDRSMPALSATASRDKDGRIHVTMTNVDPNQPRSVSISVRGQRVTGVTGRILTAAAMNAHNTFEQPNAIGPAPFNGAKITGDSLAVQLPAKSVVVLELR